jgi:hypothetical protein
LPFLGSVEYNVTERLADQADQARRDKTSYIVKLEEADREDTFKYVLLINLAALEQYIAQTRIQAQQSFGLSRVIAVAGFTVLVVGVGFGIYSNLAGKGSLDAAYLAAIAGTISQFISGIFFYLYNRTLQQLNRFHDRLIASQNMAVAFLASEAVADNDTRDKAKIDLARELMAKISPT